MTRDSRPPDYVLMLSVAALVMVGLLMVYSTTFDWGYGQYGDPLYWLKRHVLWLALGVAVAVALARIDYTLWRDWAVPLLGGTLILLLLVLILGRPQGGMQRALLGSSVQPGELAKVATVIYAAAWASSKGERIRDLTYGLIPFSVWMGLVAGLVALQPDLSTMAVIVVAGFVVFFLSGAHIGQLFVAGLMGGAVFWGLVTVYPHAHERLEAFLAGLRDPSLLPYHPLQALYALASGGLFGTGLGEGRVKFYLPAAHTDAVFAVIGEELGLVGCLLVVGLFGVLAWRGLPHRAAGTGRLWGSAGGRADGAPGLPGHFQHGGHRIAAAVHGDESTLHRGRRLLTGDLAGGGGASGERRAGASAPPLEGRGGPTAV
jgi:cell division protein FtsW